MTAPKTNAPKKEDYGATGKTREKQVPGQDGMQPHGTEAPDDDDPRRTEREREPEKA